MTFRLNQVIPAGEMRLVAMEIRREGMPIYAVIDVLSQQVLCTALSARLALTMLEREVRRATTPAQDTTRPQSRADVVYLYCKKRRRYA